MHAMDGYMIMTKGRKTRRNKPSWAAALEARRRELQRSQEEVASAAEIHQSYYSRVERGDQHLTELSHSILLRVARALEWSLPEIQQATGIDLGVGSALLVSRGQPTPVYGLQQLDEPDAVPVGMNLTPYQGKHPPNWRQVVAEDGDMEPAIRRGESVYIDTDRTEPEAGVYAVAYRGRVYLRRFKELATGYAWAADDPRLQLEFFPHGEHVQVLGRVYRVVGVREDAALLN